MHLQDWNPETKTTVAVGTGSIDWKKVFTAAKTGGVKSYFIELDMDMTRDSAAFLEKLDV
jgi:sugar phosphate isomerase/epimerase